MMNNISEKPQVVVKKKNIQVIVDYCIEQSIEFSVKPKPFPDDEWVVDISIPSIKSAIVFGMFLRENRITIAGMEIPQVLVKAKKVTVSKSDSKEITEEEEPVAEKKVVEKLNTEDEVKTLFQ